MDPFSNAIGWQASTETLKPNTEFGIGLFLEQEVFRAENLHEERALERGLSCNTDNQQMVVYYHKKNDIAQLTITSAFTDLWLRTDLFVHLQTRRYLLQSLFSDEVS